MASLLLPSLAYPGGGQAEAREPQDGGCKAFLVQSSTHTGRWCSQTDTGMQIDTCVPQLTAHCSPTPSKMPQDQLLAWARQGDRAHSEVLHANCCRAIPGDLHLALPWAQLLLCCSLCPPALPTGILVPKDLAPGPGTRTDLSWTLLPRLCPALRDGSQGHCPRAHRPTQTCRFLPS